MNEVPDLERLSESDKDELIRQLWPLVAQVKSLQAKVEELQGRLGSSDVIGEVVHVAIFKVAGYK